jgi:hypothetical protein
MEIEGMEITAEAIIDRIEDDYAGIVRLYQSVPVNKIEEASLANGWSVKDMLAHLAAWEWRCASLLMESHHSNVPLKAEPDVEALNREFYQEHKEWDWEEVEHDFRAAHRALLEAIRNLPANRLSNGFVQEAIAAETWEHYAEHLPELQQWRRRVISGR